MAFFSGNKQADNEKQTAKNTYIFDLVTKNILVTGANGQLGKEIRRTVSSYLGNLYFIFADSKQLDVTNINAIDNFVRDNNIKYIINCAAYTAVDRAEDEQELCYKVNRDAVRNIGIIANKYGTKVIHISTDYVYDGTKNSPYTELDLVNPQSIYGKSKEEGETALLKACTDSIIIRTSWLYSIYGSNFVKTMIKLGRERDSLNVVSDQIGTPTNAADLAKCIIKIIEHSESNTFKSGIYLYSNEGSSSWYDFTKKIHSDAKIFNCTVKPITTDKYPTKAKRPKYSVLDKNKIKNTFNINIPTWEESLQLCINELIKK